MTMKGFCKFYNGIHKSECDAGVAYSDFGDNFGIVYKIPCLARNGVDGCQWRQFPTDEEVAQAEAEHNAALLDVMDRVEKLMKGELRECLHCRQPITRLRQVRGCVYASPCNCRQYQGALPEWSQS